MQSQRQRCDVWLHLLRHAACIFSRRVAPQRRRPKTHSRWTPDRHQTTAATESSYGEIYKRRARDEPYSLVEPTAARRLKRRDAVPRRRPRPLHRECARRQDAAGRAAAPGAVPGEDGAHHAREGLPHRAVDPERRLREARRRGRRVARRRRGRRPLRRHGQPLRPEPDDRPHGLLGAAQARRHGAHRRAPHGLARRPHRAGLRGRGRVVHHVPPGGVAPRLRRRLNVASMA